MAGAEAEGPSRGETLWHRVRMFVSSVRGEGLNLAGTVRYRAARLEPSKLS